METREDSQPSWRSRDIDVPDDADAASQDGSGPESRPSSPVHDQPANVPVGSSAPVLRDMQVAQAFIDGLKTATLDNGFLNEKAVDRLRNPTCQRLTLDDSDEALSIKLYLALGNASQDTYNKVRDAIISTHLESKILSFDQVKRRVAELSGITPITAAMCPNSCIAYTGPFAAESVCPECHEPRYNEKGEDRQTFVTIPLGPQLQAIWSTPEGAKDLQYRHEIVDAALAELLRSNGDVPVFEDVFHGRDFIKAHHRGDIGPDDVVVMLSIDGAQLYESKKSDVWIYIWVVLDRSPDNRYKKKYVLPGGFIPGPNNPKNTDSFIFPGLHHLAGLQKEGLKAWNALDDKVITSFIFNALNTADGPGQTHLDGLVGHSGAYGCRTYCPVKGRRKKGGTYTIRRISNL